MLDKFSKKFSLLFVGFQNFVDFCGGMKQQNLSNLPSVWLFLSVVNVCGYVRCEFKVNLIHCGMQISYKPCMWSGERVSLIIDNGE